jgi:hypothetical protein
MFHRGSLQAPLRRIPDFYLTVEKSATSEVQQDAKLEGSGSMQMTLSMFTEA